MDKKPTSRRKQSECYEKFVRDFSEKIGILFAVRLHGTEPHYPIGSVDFRLDFHTKEIIFYWIFPEIECTDVSIWPPIGLESIVEKAIAEYIKYMLF
jgi:hypothetical protein